MYIFDNLTQDAKEIAKYICQFWRYCNYIDYTNFFINNGFENLEVELIALELMNGNKNKYYQIINKYDPCEDYGLLQLQVNLLEELA